MKNKLLILVSSLFMSLSIVSCGNTNESNNENNNDNNSNSSVEVPVSNSNESSKTSVEESSNNNDSGTQTVNKAQLKSKEEILAAIGSAFKISADSIPNGTPSTSASDGTYHYATSYMRTILYKQIGDKFYQYKKKNGSAKYNTMESPATDLNVIGMNNVGGLFMYADEEISYNSKEDVTFLNRSCTKYSYQTNSAVGFNQQYTEEIIIDNETGACFKHEGHGVATDGFTGSTAKENFQITEFALGIDAKNYIDGLLDDVDVYEWDEKFFTQIGLSKISQPDFELFESEWDDSSRDDSEPLWHVQYLYRVDKNVGINDIRELMEDFFNAGAKLDEDGNAMSSYNVEPIFYDNLQDYNSMLFRAYIQGNPTLAVKIDADYIDATHYWRIDFDIGYID